MDNYTVLNYQGSKNNLNEFIQKNLEPYIKGGKAVMDIFSGSGAVSNIFRKNYRVYANDSESYASIIADALLNNGDAEFGPAFADRFAAAFSEEMNTLRMPVSEYRKQEESALDKEDFYALIDLYESYPTVWNGGYSEITGCGLTVDKIREKKDYYLFVTYYASNYYGIGQALDIDCLIKTINTHFADRRNALLSCLFYAMKEAVFSKDGHMAQPLNPVKNQRRLFAQRKKHVYGLFMKKLGEYASLSRSGYSGQNKIFNSDFEELLNEELFSEIGLVYADPPYTDMQYSRYYHLLNVAAAYSYPELTGSGNGYTKGLYTEGRYQSQLSRRGSAKQSLEKLIRFCSSTGTNLALSYAYPVDRVNQATDRYTVSIDELIGLARKYYPESEVTVETQNYSHANHRNSAQKKVLEYLILCGKRNTVDPAALKKRISSLSPTKNNPMYNSHMYWSQKSFNICDVLIDTLSDKGEIVFDPFMGSGVTVLESIKSDMSRCAIGCDINDMPLFIPKTLLSVNGLPDLSETLMKFTEELDGPESRYETRCPFCGRTGIVSKTIFDKPDRMKPEIKIRSIVYQCACGKNLTKEADREDYERISSSGELENIRDTGLISNSKIAVAENDDIKNIFTGRNLAVIDEILSIIKRYGSEYGDIMKYILMSVLHLCKITDKHSNSQWPLWIPKTDCVEKNVVDIYTAKIKKFCSVITFMKDNYSGADIVDSFERLSAGKCLLMKKGSQLITEHDIPDDSVSLIITDPPYLEQVLYSEYMQLYKPFIGLDFDLEDEIVVSSAPSRSKSKEEYFTLLDRVFAVCSAKLKAGRYMCLYFHDSDLGVWDKLIAILERNSFRFVTQMHISKTVTLKNIISPKKSLNGDSILIFVKENIPAAEHHPAEEITEIERRVTERAEQMISERGPLSTPELYDDGLMEMLIRNGWLSALSRKYSSLVDIFEKHLKWDPLSAKWQ